MGYIEYSRGWIVCDAPRCENEHVEHVALEHGWTTTGTGEHLCPNHTANHPDRDLAVVDVKARAAGER